MAVTATALGKASTSAATSLTITSASAAAAGTLVFVSLTTSSNSCTIGVSDSKSNTWQQTASPDNPGTNYQASLFWCLIPDAGHALTTSDTITGCPSNATSAQMTMQATAYLSSTGFTGTTSTVGDKASKNDPGTSTTAMACAATSALAQTSELVVAAFSTFAAVETVTPGTGYTADPNDGTSSAGTPIGMYSEYQVVSSTAAVTPTATGSASSTFAALCATFTLVGVAQQALRPSSDITTTGWATTPLWSKLNDSSDSTFVTSTV